MLEEDATAFDYDDVYETLKAPAEKKEVAVLGAGTEALGRQPGITAGSRDDQKHQVRVRVRTTCHSLTSTPKNMQTTQNQLTHCLLPFSKEKPKYIRKLLEKAEEKKVLNSAPFNAGR